jgi:hypothetical protein
MGQRVRNIMHELHGEKIDIVDWSDDPAELVAHALSPARVSKVEVVDAAARSARVIVPDYQLSLAIGKEGQNARLAAKLTGWRIDIKSEAMMQRAAEGEPVEGEETTVFSTPEPTPEEIAAIRAAAGLVDEIYAWLAEQGLVGRTEREVALTLEQELRVRGADGPSFAAIVAAAENGALPHAVPRDVAISRDALVTLDIGARVDGYCSDCTRTWATGTLDDDLSELYDTVLRAQEAALAAVRPGPEGREVDAVARDLIAAAGHGEHFGHGLGHGVGLEVHEGPRLARTAEARLVAGNVVTVEPGVYLPGRGGVRIEDLVVVEADGHRVLSGTTKELVFVD